MNHNHQSDYWPLQVEEVFVEQLLRKILADRDRVI